MSTSVRTNLLPDPSFELGAGGFTGTNCSVAQVYSSTIPLDGQFALKLTVTATGTFSINTASGTSGFPVTVGTSYAFQIATKTATTSRGVTPTITWYNSSGTLLSTSSGTAVTDVSTGYTVASLAAVAPTSAAYAALGVLYASSSSGEVHYVDCALFETSATINSWFDGSSVNAAGVVYAWTGSADASTSTATSYIPSLALTTGLSPCPNVTITITDVAPTTDNVCNVWVTADGERTAVRGAQGVYINGSTVVYDYEVPLGRTVQYDLEVTKGASAGVVTPSATTTVTSPLDSKGKPLWWIQDPKAPGTAIALAVTRGDSSHPYLTADAVKSLEYDADISIINVAGSKYPIGIGGQRLAAKKVPFNIFTNAATAGAQLESLLTTTALLLVRPPGTSRDGGIPGKWYTAVAAPVKNPITIAYGGTLTQWNLSGDTVAPPTAALLVPIWTYQAVQNLWATYQQAQTALASKSYLDVLKSPAGT